MADGKDLADKEYRVSQKKLYKKAAYINSGPLSQQAIENWIDAVIRYLREKHRSVFGTAQIKYEVSALRLVLSSSLKTSSSKKIGFLRTNSSMLVSSSTFRHRTMVLISPREAVLRAS